MEDEFLIALELSEILEEAGARVVGPASHAGEALGLLGGEAVDLAVLDVDLGDHGAEPVARLLAERGTPFLFHTGRGLPASLRACFTTVPLLVKPAPRPALIDALCHLAGDGEKGRAH